MAPSVGVSEPLVDVIAESVRAFDDGRSVHEVMCRGVATVVRATVASFVRLNAVSEQCTVICWPEQQQWVALRYVTRESWPDLMSAPESPTASAGTWRWRRTLAFGILRDLVGSMHYAEIDLGHGRPTEDRLAIFARQEPWREGETRLLAACAEPLAVIDNHLLHLEALRRGEGVHARGTYRGQARPAGRPPSLTRRELEVLALLRQGLKARTMAGRLGVSQRTVNKHLGNLYRKLDAHDRVLAVQKAQTLGILPP